ncbi:MAG: sulfatase-like hydrolase/transferase, partial [Candidatus Aminicenantes bacterium]
MKTPLKRRDFLKTLGLGTAALSLSSIHGCGRKLAPRTGPPNFVVIFTDDQGFADVGCYGAKGFETPNLDRMAKDGMRFTSFYVSQAVCSASRASLITGCYPNRVSIYGALNPHAKIGLNPEEETIAEVLKTKGYACGIFGKWHLGHHKEFLPLQHGFDE